MPPLTAIVIFASGDSTTVGLSLSLVVGTVVSLLVFGLLGWGLMRWGGVLPRRRGG